MTAALELQGIVGTGPGGLPIMSRCAKCGKEGHNSRTCGQEIASPAAAAKPAAAMKAKVKKADAPPKSARRGAAAKPQTGTLAAIEAAITDVRAELVALEKAAEVMRRRSVARQGER